MSIDERAKGASCPCGLHTPTLSSLGGRVGVRFSRPDGTSWDPAAVGPALGRLPLTAFQLVEDAPLRLTLRYEAPEPLDLRSTEAVCARLRAVAGQHIQLHLDHRRDPMRLPGVKPVPFLPASVRGPSP